MKRTSAPEQALLYYIRKYVDSEATNNVVRIEKYTADISFRYKGNVYDLEYDSYSQHSQKYEADIVRNEKFKENGYIVIRMRDRKLDFLPNCVNIRFDFQDYRKSSLLKAQEGIAELLAYFGIRDTIDFEQDSALFKQMYDNA